MHKLSGIDATFLYMETNETPMHISSLLLCAPAPKGAHPYEALKAQIVERLHEIPSFHRKLKHTPFYIDHPVWVEADIVDLDYHIKHARLPDPGNLEQLRMIVQGLHSTSLDRDRPLWQFYIIEGVEDPAFGLEKGGFALYTKAHHASLDGGAGISVMDILSDSEPTPRPPLPNNEVRLFKEDAGAFELLGSAYGRFIQQQLDLVKSSPAIVKAFRKVVKNAAENGDGLLEGVRPAPKTRFNVRVQKQRAFGALTLPIKEVIAVAKQSNATLNDVVLAICGGALRRYLIGHDELPKRGLVAAVPVSLRELGDNTTANQVASMNCEIGTDIADPLARLKAVNKNSKRAKKGLAAIKDIFPTDYSFFGAPIAVSALAQLTSRTNVINYMPAALNVAISNVPGSRKPMYFAGSKVIANFPVSIATHGCALNITLTSYIDRLDFGLVACKVAVPDVQDIAEGITEEFKLLKTAVSAASTKATNTDGKKNKPTKQKDKVS
jgi:diacylglycerol O-acyltransferase / wax synthase